MIGRKEGINDVLGIRRMGVFPRLDMQIGGTKHQSMLDGRPLIRARKTHEEYQMDALRRWLRGEDEALEDWLAE
ncbi:MAG: hypothetical protein LN417_08430 [Candidatus Thermoplasmatota archaeon]|nr:hypothetical protein [Candidatus Thermoplasmatota archaeon]